MMGLAPLIDFQDAGIGDVVVGCWLARSCTAAGLGVRMNPRSRRDVAVLLGIEDTLLTAESGPSWSRTPALGTQFEYAQVPIRSQPGRFDLWCESLGLPPLAPVRPRYVESAEAGDWAELQWRRIDPTGRAPRVALFPASAWSVRVWPLAYHIDLSASLRDAGCVVVGFGAREADVRGLHGNWWWGLPLPQVAAMLHRAHLVIANESGPAHLAGAIGTSTLAVCGPTRGEVVFAHDPLITPVSLSRDELSCVGCHFSPRDGYRDACSRGGCQGLMRLDPERVGRVARRLLGVGG